MSITCSGCDAIGDGLMAGFIVVLIVILLAYLIPFLHGKYLWFFHREEMLKIKQEQEEIMLENRRRYFEDIGRDLDEQN
tara:strand:+ start:54 stop:290 length:237 start_codon:yes stop_codon:yes gene_type:complete